MKLAGYGHKDDIDGDDGGEKSEGVFSRGKESKRLEKPGKRLRTVEWEAASMKCWQWGLARRR
jgi:hypothetical protein